MDYGRGDRGIRTLLSVVINQMKVSLPLLSSPTTEKNLFKTTTVKRTNFSTRNSLLCRKSLRKNDLTADLIDHFPVPSEATPLGGGSGVKLSSLRADRDQPNPSSSPVSIMSPSANMPYIATAISSSSLALSNCPTFIRTHRNKQKQTGFLIFISFISFLTDQLSWAQLLFEPNPQLTAGRPWNVGNTPQPNGYTRGPSRCYDDSGKAQRCVPPFVNAAFNQLVEATNTCGIPPIEYCRQTGVTGNGRLLL